MCVLRAGLQRVTRRCDDRPYVPGKYKFNKNKGKSKAEPDEEAEAALSADLRESDAVMDPRERRKLQTQILEAMFEVYFRILKMGKGMAVALLPSTFAGLAKFSHLISIDFLGDLLVALQVRAEYAAPHVAATLLHHHARRCKSL